MCNSSIIPDFGHNEEEDQALRFFLEISGETWTPDESLMRESFLNFKREENWGISYSESEILELDTLEEVGTWIYSKLSPKGKSCISMSTQILETDPLTAIDKHSGYTLEISIRGQLWFSFLQSGRYDSQFIEWYIVPSSDVSSNICSRHFVNINEFVTIVLHRLRSNDLINQEWEDLFDSWSAE